MEIKILKGNGSKGFKMLAGINRAIIPNHVTKLAESINLMGIIRPVVVAKIPFIDNGTYIIDGQHLYHACLRDSHDIPYIIITIKNKQDLIEKIALLNASSKSWCMDDYVTAWKFINPDYDILSTMKATYDMELGMIAAILMGRSVNAGGSISTIIKKGNFYVHDKERGIKILDICTDVLKLVPRMDRYSNRTFLASFVDRMRAAGSSYNHKHFINFLTKNKQAFVLATQDPNEISKLIEKGLL